MDEKNKKDTFLIVRITQMEREFLADKAKLSHFKITDYVRYRLFDEPDFTNQKINCDLLANKSRFACDHDKELMKHIFRMYLYSREMFKLQCSTELYKTCNDLARIQLKEWGYE